MSGRPRNPNSNRAIAEHMLTTYGRIEAYDAVYRLTDAEGNPRRNTRLAVTIFDLRREGWDIETVRQPGKLATYIYHGRKTVNEPKTVGLEAIVDQLVVEYHAEVDERYYCTRCGAVAYEVEKSFDTKFGMGRCLGAKCIKLGKVPVKQR